MTRRVQVQSLSELTPGVRVELMDCHICGASRHRGIVVGSGRGEVLDPTGDVATEDYVDAAPPLDCMPDRDWVIGTDEIEQQVVYRFIDLDDAEQATRRRRTKRLANAVRSGR